MGALYFIGDDQDPQEIPYDDVLVPVNPLMYRSILMLFTVLQLSETPVLTSQTEETYSRVSVFHLLPDYRLSSSDLWNYFSTREIKHVPPGSSKIPVDILFQDTHTSTSS